MEYYAIECTIAMNVKRYFCYYAILDEMEIRLVKELKEAILYTENELCKALMAMHENMDELMIRKSNVIKIKRVG